MRGAVVDLAEFDDYEEVAQRFFDSSLVQYQYLNGVYALPETQNFQVMFYRTDIMEELGLEVPQTWADVYDIIPELQNNYMNFGFPANVNNFYTLLYQRGGSVYRGEGETLGYATNLDSPTAIEAFIAYVDLYRSYKIELQIDFQNRFRTGEVPIGIADFTTMNALSVTAPEIRGLWDIAILPGTSRTAEDGSTYVDHSGHSQGACCMMIATDSETTKQNAWQFMKWWTSTDAQVRFGREIEAVLGSSARYATANIAAIEQLSWSEAQLKVIREQMTWAVGFREVAGGYYTTRHMTNAVRKVTNDKTDPRETLLDYARTINEEINKKRLEFGLPIDEETP